MTITRMLAANGKRYRLTWLVGRDVIQVSGPGVLGLFLPQGVTLELPDRDLREHLKEALAAYLKPETIVYQNGVPVLVTVKPSNETTHRPGALP